MVNALAHLRVWAGRSREVWRGRCRRRGGRGRRGWSGPVARRRGRPGGCRRRGGATRGVTLRNPGGFW